MARIASLPLVAGLSRVAGEEPGFLVAFADAVERLGWSQDHADMLASLIAHESGFKASALNPQRHAGLIQFSPGTLSKWGLTPEGVVLMSATDQLELVERYFRPIKGIAARDIAMAGLGWGIGKPDDVIVWSKDGSQGERDGVQPKGYAQNPGLDVDKDGLITLGEIRDDVARPLRQAKGRIPITGGPSPTTSQKSSSGGLMLLGLGAALLFVLGRKK